MPLANGCNHIALVTQDLERFVDFYRRVFDAEVVLDMEEGPMRHAMVDVGGGFWLHPFQFADDNPHAAGRDEVFQRGHLDHLAIAIDDAETFEEVRTRLVEAGAADGTVTDFGALRTVWFEDPDGMGAEIAIVADGAPLAFDERGQERYSAAAG